MAMLAKPSRLARDVAKWESARAREARKRAEDKAEAAEWAKVSRLVKARDGNRCRVCGVVTQRFGVGDPRLWAHVHHIVYRSAGGGSYPGNLILLCGKCHDDEHQHRLDISGTADKLRLERRS